MEKQKTHSLSEMRELHQQFSDYVKKFRKDNDLSWKDLFKIVRDSFLWVREVKSAREKDEDRISIEQIDYSKLSLPDISEKTVDDFSEWNENMVQQVIDFVNNHPDLKEVIEKRHKEMTFTEVYDDKEFTCRPDLTFSFSIDNLMYSIAENKWTPFSDTYMGYNLGREQEIIYIM